MAVNARPRRWIMLRLARKRLGDQHGFTLIELLIVVGIVAILTSTAVPIYANIQQRARIAKAQADTRAVTAALNVYMAHCSGMPAPGGSGTNCPISAATAEGTLPGVLLLPQQNVQNQLGGPFMASIPVLPAGWTGSGSTYKYSLQASGAFTICASGDGTGVNSNGSVICP
jgi:prepilin-type N-terminal cleavage/methylation domain-containing protein